MKERSEEIPYWWHVTTQIWVVLLIRWSKFSTIQRDCFITLPAILKPGVSELHEDFQFALRDTNRLESRLPGKSTDPRICVWGVEVKERCRRLWSFFLVFSEWQGHFQVLYKLQEVLPWWANWDKANCAEQWVLFHHWQVIWMAEHLRQHAQTSTRQGTHKLPNKMLIKRMESRGWPMD